MSSIPGGSQPESSGSDPANSPPSSARVPPSKKQWFYFGTLLTVVLVLIVLNVVFRLLPTDEEVPTTVQRPAEAPAEPSFKGASDDLHQTIVVPTLESSLPPDTSAIWCGTLALAWQEAEKEVTKGPLVLLGEEETCQNLSRTPRPELQSQHYYVAAGFYGDGIEERMRRELPARFPKAPMPKFETSPLKSFMAYAYLEVALRYEHEFQRCKDPFLFTDSRGKKTKVDAFGIRPQDANDGFSSCRAQVRVLFKEGDEFAVDLSTGSEPYQIVLARMERKSTLKSMLAHLDKKIAAFNGTSHLGDASVLLVPSMNWEIDHRFRKLEGKWLRHPADHFLNRAYQFIHFKMDRKGASLSSGANNDWAGNGHVPAPNINYIFDRPYLLIMKKRGFSQPFLMMWVANAELLQPS